MTKFVRICSLALSVIAVLSLLAALFFLSAAETAGVQLAPADGAAKAVYHVRLDGGVLGAYLAEDGTLLFSSMVDVGEIPVSDREMLEGGVPAGTLEDVLNLFEDFCS